MPFPPAGLKAVEHPLYHRFDYAFGLSGVTATKNSVWIPLVKNYKTTTAPSSVFVNPHSDQLDLETGAICAPMSIIQNLRLHISASKSMANNSNTPIKFSWTPFFCSFDKLIDAQDDDAGATVASIMHLTKDATEEDVTPLVGNTKLPITVSSKSHAVSTVNLTEAIGHLNYDTDLTMESCAFDMEAMRQLLKFGTNSKALRACLGRTRYYSMDNNRRMKHWFIKKFVPRAVRRIVPYSWFGLLFHMPLEIDKDGFYQDVTLTPNVSHIGIKVSVDYEEWNSEHNNTMADA